MRELNPFVISDNISVIKMLRRTIVLKINNRFHKFLSIFFSEKDDSFYVITHLTEKSAPFLISDPIHLLRNEGNLTLERTQSKIEINGDKTHISFHPKRIYLKHYPTGGGSNHLIEEFEPQRFNDNNFRLLGIITPPVIEFLPVIKNEEDKNILTFDWDSEYCPQISIYEVKNNFTEKDIKSILSDGEQCHIIKLNEDKPLVLLQIKSTNGDPGVWEHNIGIFGKLINKNPISREELERIIKYNNLNFDISSIPENNLITNYKIEWSDLFRDNE